LPSPKKVANQAGTVQRWAKVHAKVARRFWGHLNGFDGTAQKTPHHFRRGVPCWGEFLLFFYHADLKIIFIDSAETPFAKAKSKRSFSDALDEKMNFLFI
tara:strand:+ start:193 stop:492 length:300 start_codon:yes stop_codon:yes gene_type:complete